MDALAGRTIDKPSVLGGRATLGTASAGKVASAWREHLFGEATPKRFPPPS